MTEDPAAKPGPTGVPLAVLDEKLLASIRFDDHGLVPVVIQDAVSSAVLTVGYANDEALRRTIATGRTWLWSRSRQEFWCKGETSGDRQYVREMKLDCDEDAIVVLVDQHGDGACHTKAWSCFFRSIAAGPGVPRPTKPDHPPVG